MKVIITGGSGFIGSNFVLYMLNKYPDYQIINLDSLTYAGNQENLKDARNYPNYTFVKGDITDRQLVAQLFQQSVDVVVNFAAESHVDRSIREPDIFVKTNVMGTQVLLDAAKQYGVKRFVQISTDEVYGSLGETGFFTEHSPLLANSPYSATKAGADLLARVYYETFRLPVNITRCSNNYGRYQFPEKLIPLMIINAVNNKSLPLYGDGLNIRDWLYVEDHCSAIDLVMHNGVIGEIYNIGGNNERTNLQIVKSILAELGKPESLITYVSDRPGHDRRYGIDATKIMRELGWRPKYDFETGIKKTIDWYLNNQHWWKKIQYSEYRTDAELKTDI
jgi:dTDP-glucose 4,6-dehydratase